MSATVRPDLRGEILGENGPDHGCRLWGLAGNHDRAPEPVSRNEGALQPVSSVRPDGPWQESMTYIDVRIWLTLNLNPEVQTNHGLR